MEIVLLEHLTDPAKQEAIRQLLILADQEFVPPLSARTSSTQLDLAPGGTGSIDAYYDTIRDLPVVLALDGDKVVGFMHFRFDHTCSHITQVPNAYACTSSVHPDGRGHGLMQKFYTAIIEAYPDRMVCTRTWHTNLGHLHILSKLGFAQTCCLENDRGPGIHTVYYALPPRVAAEANAHRA